MKDKFFILFILKVALLLVAVCIPAIIVIFAYTTPNEVVTDHSEDIHRLEDTIKVLREDIAKYQSEISRINLEREAIRKELKRIMNDNEKTDSILDNGGIDANIKFLTEYLSKKDSLRK